MWQYNYTYSSSLCRHGILGQKWGKRNGPPYPLGSSKHSASEKKAGWQKSLSNNKNKSKSLTSNGKKEYTNSKKINKALSSIGEYKISKSIKGKLSKLVNLGRRRTKGFLAGSSDGFEKLPHSEQVSDTIKNANPNRGNPKYTNNCSACGLAGFLRQQGYDVIAKDTGGKMQNMNDVVEECFKIPNRNKYIKDGSAVKFGRSRKDAAEFLVKRFGDNAEGVCSIQWKGGGGHIFNWTIKDGEVLFFDAQKGLEDSTVSRIYWNAINPQGALQVSRLDGLEINWDAISKYIE